MLCCRLATRRKQPCHSVPLFLGTLSRVFSRRLPLCSESGTLSPRLTSEGPPTESPWETGKPVPVPPYCAELSISRIKLPHPPLSSIHVDLFPLLSWISSHHKVPDTQPGLEDHSHFQPSWLPGGWECTHHLSLYTLAFAHTKIAVIFILSVSPRPHLKLWKRVDL